MISKSPIDYNIIPEVNLTHIVQISNHIFIKTKTCDSDIRNAFFCILFFKVGNIQDF